MIIKNIYNCFKPINLYCFYYMRDYHYKLLYNEKQIDIKGRILELK